LGLIAFAPALKFGGISSPHIDVGLGILVALMAGFWLSQMWKSHRIWVLLVMGISLAANIIKIEQVNPFGSANFAIQGDLNLRNEMQSIDYVYRQAGGKPFGLTTVTAPLYINTTWSYLFNWYGLKQYGYLPFWMGKDQTGWLGNNLPASINQPTQLFMIIEPSLNGDVIPLRWIELAQAEVQNNYTLIDQISFGQLIAQKWQLKSQRQ
jgi:hypothetical protein